MMQYRRPQQTNIHRSPRITEPATLNRLAKPPGNSGNVWFWSIIGGLVLLKCWPTIGKFLSQPMPMALPPQLAYTILPPVKSVPPQPEPALPWRELPPLPPMQLSQEEWQQLSSLFGGQLLRNPGIETAELMGYPEPSDAPLARRVDHPSLVVVIGPRGGGKTGAMLRIQELLRDVDPPYAVGLPAGADRLLPDWYGLADNPEDIPNNATVYFPESYRFFHARSTQSQLGRSLSDLVNLSRHRRHTLLFDVQNTSQLDRNILSEADLVLVKEPGPFHQGFERS
jgi:hypothetical protein